MNYPLLPHGDPHAIIPVEKRSADLAALEDANAGNCEPFAAFILGCVMDSIAKLIGKEVTPADTLAGTHRGKFHSE